MAQRRKSVYRNLTILMGAAALIVTAGMTPARAAPTTDVRVLAPTDQFAVRTPDAAGTQQVDQLKAAGNTTEADQLSALLSTPQADWFVGGSPDSVQQGVASVTADAAQQQKVPVLVMYNVPGRDCSQYSAGGAATDAEYRAWVDGFVAGIGSAHAVVLVEPDGLANLPSDCPSAYPGQDIDALTTSRIADISYAAQQVENSDPNSLVYLDAGNSEWHSVGDIAQRLYSAGVGDVQGFFLNVSNFQYAVNSDFYGSWISDCLAYATDLNSTHTAVAPDGYADCSGEYYDGGPANNWNGQALSEYGQWSDTATDPALNTAGVDSRYALELGTVTPTVHYVVDSSRAGAGPDSMSTFAAAPYDQPQSVVDGLVSGSWCNPPDATVGPLPAPDPEPTKFPTLDAHVWVKTVGESDGSCGVGGARSWDYNIYNPWGWDTDAQLSNDPLWGQLDPGAGVWFPDAALQFARSMPTS